MTHRSTRSVSATTTPVLRAITAALTASAALASAPVLAQEQPAGAAGQTAQNQTAQTQNTGELQQVVVTARYRQENLQSTPLSITAITAEDLQQQQLVNVNDIGNTIPNAFFRQPVSNFGPTETIGLRGFTQTDFNYAFQPTVGFYIDDVYQGTLTASSFDLADLERVEVLNGPQGTLFGINSIGGAIRLITNKPKGDNTGSVEVTYGQHHRTDLVGIADLGLIDQKLSFRIVGVSRSQDSIGKFLDFSCFMRLTGAPQSAYGSLPESINPGLGTGCGLGGLGGFNHQNVRGALRYVPMDKLEFNVNAYYTKQSDDPPLQTLLSPYGGPHDILNTIYSSAVIFPKFGMNYTNNPYLVSPSPWDNFSSFGDITTGQSYNPKAILSEYGVSATADYDITDTIHAKYIWGYRTYQTTWINDSDLTPFGLEQTNYLQSHRQFQNELRLTGTSFGDHLEWTVGGFYYDARDLESNTSNFDAFDFLGILHNNFVTTGFTNNNQSGFFHLNYKFTDQWSLSGGWRYTSQYLTNTYTMENTTGETLLSLPAPVQISGSRGDWSGSINFQATPDLFFYAEAASGFTLPGFNSRVETIGQLEETVPGQEAVNYELGFKTDWLDHRLRVNGSVFYEDYKSYLLLELATQCTPANDLNPGTPIFGLPPGAPCPAGTPLAGKPGLSPWFFYAGVPAYMPGFELEANAEPIDRLLIDFNAGWLKFYDKITDPTNPGFIDRSVRLQPEWDMSGGIQYGVRFGNGATLTPRLDWRYQGYMTNGPANVDQIRPDFIVPGYSLFNASLTYQPQSASWRVALQAQNLFNKFYWEQLGAASSLIVPGPVGAPTPDNLYPSPARVGTPGMPRQWMITVTKNF